MLVLGGGGYTIRNVARCWSLETAVLLDKELDDGNFTCCFHFVRLFLIPFIIIELPFNDYLGYFGPDYRLHISPSNMENRNSTEYLESCKYVNYNRKYSNNFLTNEPE